MGKKIQAHLAQHLSTFLVGFTGILGKTIHQNPILIVFFRTFFAAIGMFPFFLSKKKTVTLTFLNFKNHFLFFCLGVVFVLHWFTFFTGVQKATASLGTLAPFLFFFFFRNFLVNFLLLFKNFALQQTRKTRIVTTKERNNLTSIL